MKTPSYTESDETKAQKARAIAEKSMAIQGDVGSITDDMIRRYGARATSSPILTGV